MLLHKKKKDFFNLNLTLETELIIFSNKAKNMKFIINLKSEQIEGVTHWSGGVAPVHKAAKGSNITIATSDSVLTQNKSNITSEIEKRLAKKDFAVDEIEYNNVRMDNIEQLMALLEAVV